MANIPKDSGPYPIIVSRLFLELVYLLGIYLGKPDLVSPIDNRMVSFRIFPLLLRHHN